MLQRAELPVELAGVEASRAFFASCFVDARQETLWVAHLDAQARCIHLTSHDGGTDAAPLPTREIICDAARLGSAGLILAHNHPSGDAEPSPTDYAITRRLAVVTDAIGVTLVDHLIFAGEDCTSFRRRGLL